MDKNLVMKELSPEDQTALSNIVAIAQEILESNAGGGMGGAPEETDETGMTAENPVEAAMKDQYTEPDYVDKEPEEGNKAKKARKSIENTKSEGPTADDDAETRDTEALPEESEAAVAQVAKMLLGIMGKGQTVKKSRPSKMVETISVLAKAIQKQGERQDLIAKTLEGLLSATGITQQIGVMKSANTPKTLPVQNPDVDALANFIRKSIGQNPTTPQVQKSQSEQVADGINDLLGGFSMFRGNK